MRRKENKPELLNIRTLKKDGGRKTAKSRKVQFFNDRDFMIFADVNGINV